MNLIADLWLLILWFLSYKKNCNALTTENNLHHSFRSPYLAWKSILFWATSFDWGITQIFQGHYLFLKVFKKSLQNLTKINSASILFQNLLITIYVPYIMYTLYRPKRLLSNLYQCLCTIFLLYIFCYKPECKGCFVALYFCEHCLLSRNCLKPVIQNRV